MRFLRCRALLQIGAAAAGGGGGDGEGFLLQTAIKDGGVSCEQRKLQQGPAFIVHGRGLHGEPPPPEDWRGKDGHVLPSTLKTAGTLGNSV